jgi:hypothetical protein
MGSVDPDPAGEKSDWPLKNEINYNIFNGFVLEFGLFFMKVLRRHRNHFYI